MIAITFNKRVNFTFCILARISAFERFSRCRTASIYFSLYVVYYRLVPAFLFAIVFNSVAIVLHFSLTCSVYHS